METYANEKGNGLRYLQMLAKQYPTVQSASSEIINLQAILNLPKGTEHFMSDIHGEADAFLHILNNASGVIKEKIDLVYSNMLSQSERKALAALIYYPELKISEVKETEGEMEDWYRITLNRLIEVCSAVTSKYTRSKVRKALPKDFEYIIDELLHTNYAEHNKEQYYENIISTIIDREYVERENRQLRATQLGFVVTDWLTKNFENIVDEEFGAMQLRGKSLIDCDEDLGFEFVLSYPASITIEEIMDKVKSKLSENLKAECAKNYDPVRFEKTGFLCSSLQKAYEKITGFDGTPVTTTGGTYAKLMPNIVPFGPSFPGQKGIGHNPDEWMDRKDLMTNAKIYALSLLYLGSGE